MVLRIFKPKEDKYWADIKETIAFARGRNVSWGGAFAVGLVLNRNLPFHWDKTISARFADKHGAAYLTVIGQEVDAGRFTDRDVLVVEHMHLAGIENTQADIHSELMALIDTLSNSDKDFSSSLKKFSMVALERNKATKSTIAFDRVIDANFKNLERSFSYGSHKVNGALNSFCTIASAYPQILTAQYGQDYISIAKAYGAENSDDYTSNMMKLFDLVEGDASQQCKDIVTSEMKNYVEYFNTVASFNEEDEQKIIKLGGALKHGVLENMNAAPKGVSVSDLEIIRLNDNENLTGALVSFNNAACERKHVLFTQKQKLDGDGKLSGGSEVSQLTDNVEQALINAYGEDAAPLVKKLTRSMPAARLIV
jgi:hypothetical protein